MDYKDDVQAQNLVPYGCHDTGFRFERSGLKKQRKNDGWEDVLSIWTGEKDSWFMWMEEAKGKSGEELGGTKGSDSVSLQWGIIQEMLPQV